MKFRLPITRDSERPARRLPKFGWTEQGSIADEPDSVVRPRIAARARLMGGLVGVCMLSLVVKSSSLMMLPDSQLESKANTQFKLCLAEVTRQEPIQTI